MSHERSLAGALCAALLLVLAPAGAGAEPAESKAAIEEEDGLFGLSFQQSDAPRSSGVRGEPMGTWSGEVDRATTDWDGRQPQTEVSADYFPAPKHAGRPQSEPRPKPVKNEVVRRIQEDLQKLGYDPGPVDGMFGARTMTAIRAYQGDRDMAQTGGVSPSLVDQISEEVAALDDEAGTPGMPSAPALRAAAVPRNQPLTLEARSVEPVEPAETAADSLVEDAVFGEPAPSLRAPAPSSQQPAMESDAPAEEPNAMPPTMAMREDARPLHLAALDLAAVRHLGADLPPALLEKLLVARWHYEAATEEPEHGRFFAPGDGLPEAGAMPGLLPAFLEWAETQAPALPFAVVTAEPLQARQAASGVGTALAVNACFDPAPHLMARAHIDTAAEFCRAALVDAAPAGVGTLEPDESARLQACRKLIDFSQLRLYHQITGGEACGGAGYTQPQFLLDRAYILHLALATSGAERQNADAAGQGAARHFQVSGVRYATDAPSMYSELQGLLAESGFARIVGGVPESMNPAQHYLIFDVRPLGSEIAAAGTSPQQAAAAQD